MKVERKHISLPVGKTEKLEVIPTGKVLLSTNHPGIIIDKYGHVTAIKDALGEDARGEITVSTIDGKCIDTYEFTIVNWAANTSKLQIVDKFPYCTMLTCRDNTIYFSRDNRLYSCRYGIHQQKLIAKLPDKIDNMLITPFGYFIRCGADIYRSMDLVSWRLSYSMAIEAKHHMFDYFYDKKTNTGYIYSGEYSTDEESKHRVYRGIIDPDGEEKWDIRLEFDSIRDWQTDNSILNASRHVHVVIVDHYTGHLWAGTGDSDMHCRILYSDDHGESFRLIGMGSHEWTTLSIWFTKRYVYWNMDTSKPESIWRIPRSIYEENGFWPCITPEFSSGFTKVGCRYYITKNKTSGHFPKGAGKIYIENKERPLDSGNKVRAINDADYDYREQVVKLCTGAHWYHCWAKDDSGSDILIMSTSPEGRNPVTGEYPGTYRDWRGRAFGIKERPDGSCDVQELISVPPKDPDAGAILNRYTQLEPKFQDQEGYIYFTGKNTEWYGIYKTRLKWTDFKD